MPIYLESQRNGNSIAGVAQKVSIQYDTDHWEINKWDGNGWITPSDQARFVPEFAVRTIKVTVASSDPAVVEMDIAGNSNDVVGQNTVKIYESHVIDYYNVGTKEVERVTSIYLTGSASTFTSLTLGT